MIIYSDPNFPDPNFRKAGCKNPKSCNDQDKKQQTNCAQDHLKQFSSSTRNLLIGCRRAKTSVKPNCANVLFYCVRQVRRVRSDHEMVRTFQCHDLRLRQVVDK